MLGSVDECCSSCIHKNTCRLNIVVSLLMCLHAFTKIKLQLNLELDGYRNEVLSISLPFEFLGPVPRKYMVGLIGWAFYTAAYGLYEP